MYISISGSNLIPNNGSVFDLFVEKSFKKSKEYFLKFLFFYLKVHSFSLIIENNFSQMAASAGHAVAYTIDPSFKHIMEYVQLYFPNSFTNIVLLSVNYLWLVGVTLIFNNTSQIIVQRCQIAATRWQKRH